MPIDDATEQEAKNLLALFQQRSDDPNPFLRISSRAAFARDHGIPGGPSMISQHLSGHRPISLQAAIAYAKGFNVSLEAISPRLAREVAEATRGRAAEAHEASLPIPRVGYIEPQTLDWRDLRMLTDVPETFRVQLHDDSMGRKLPKGRWVVFDRADSAGNRRAVLVRVDGAEVYLRRVKEVDGGWIAKPDDEDFKSFDSRTHALQIVAVMRHAEVPDEE